MKDNAFQRRRDIERMLLSGKKLTTSEMMKILTLTKQKNLCVLYDKAEGKEKEILVRIIHKYGATKLEI